VTTDEDRVLRGVWREIQVTQVGRLHGTQKFENEIENSILNTLIYFTD